MMLGWHRGSETMRSLRELCRRFDPFVAIDFSEDTVRIVSSRSAGGGGENPTIYSFRYDKNYLKADEYGAQVRAALRDRFAHCLIGLPTSEALVMTIAIPSDVAWKNYTSVHQWALSQVPLDESCISVAIDVHALKGTPFKVASIAALKRTRLEWFHSIADSAGLTVERMTLRQCALVHVSGLSSTPGQCGIQVIIDTDEYRSPAHIFYDTKWLASWEALGAGAPEGFTISQVRERLTALGIASDEPITVSQIGEGLQSVRCSQVGKDLGHVIFTPTSLEKDLYALGLVALGKSDS